MRATPALPLSDKPSIAVLPFQNLSGDSEQEYFADGVVEDIITALSRMRWLFVIARNSSFTYKGRAVDVKQVGRELGVRYVLEGSVRRSANRVRITGQLIDASTGAHLWMTDRAQEISEGARLAWRALELGKDDAVALARAGHALALLVGDLDTGVAFIDRAVTLDPNLARGWYASGWVRVYRGEPEVAIEHQARAMRLSPLDPTLDHMQVGTALAHMGR